jgi:hypothetical protein
VIIIEIFRIIKKRQLNFYTIYVILGLVGLIFLWIQIILPWKRIRECSRRSMCLTNLRHLWAGLVFYAEDYQGYFPDKFFHLYPKYISSPNYFFCPGTIGAKNITKITVEDVTISYFYTSGLTKNSPPECLLIYDREENHKGEGRNVLFVNGETLWIVKDKWPEVYKRHLSVVGSFKIQKTTVKTKQKVGNEMFKNKKFEKKIKKL